MIVKNAEKHCSMLMNYTKQELTRVNFHGGKLICFYLACIMINICESLLTSILKIILFLFFFLSRTRNQIISID